MQRVGVRELRQNLSVYLKRVARGEALEVTEHGHPVAVLAPLPQPTSPLDRLLASGRARPPEGTWEDVPRPIGPTSTAGSDALAADREGKE